MFEWYIFILFGITVGWLLHERKHKILWFFRDVDNQVHMMIAGILGLAGFATAGIFIGAFLNVPWLFLVGLVCWFIFVAIMVVIYQPWKRFTKRVKQK